VLLVSHDRADGLDRRRLEMVILEGRKKCRQVDRTKLSPRIGLLGEILGWYGGTENIDESKQLEEAQQPLAIE
jgi:hypothetical protein